MGGLVSKTLTPTPWAGNPQRRTAELPGIGMLNSIGLQNMGLPAFLDHELDTWAKTGLPCILSLSANSIDEFMAMANTIEDHPLSSSVRVLELNLSCPNVAKGGLHFGVSPACVQETVAAVVSTTTKPVFAKLTPNVTDMIPIAAAALEGGATGLTAINTVLGMAIDIEEQRPVLVKKSGGYSGPGIFPIALHHVYQLYHHFPTTPIIAVGGVSRWKDIIAFMLAGASLVQIGTMAFREPKCYLDFTEGMTGYLKQHSIADWADLRGNAHY
jgi:dihydroorotate dehydrogenase (NAD+) catalytic subunit